MKKTQTEAAIVPQIDLIEAVNLPPKIASQTIAILGNRGGGKTNTARRLAEQLIRGGVQVVYVDPLDCTWGLRYKAVGELSDLPIYIIGGRYADFDIEADQGDALARLVVDKGISCVLSCSHIRKRERGDFIAAFLNELYQLKDTSRTPVHVILDEARMFVPQRGSKATKESSAAIEDCIRAGRTRGIGVTLIDQRAASVNKDVLNMLEILIAHRHTSPHDRKTLQEWVKAHDPGGQAETLDTTIATLENGEAWLWSPSVLKCFERVRVKQADTYDSSATPDIIWNPSEVDNSKATSAEIAEEIGHVLSKKGGDFANHPVKPEDPTIALKAQIAQLRSELEAKGKTPGLDPSLIASTCLAGMRDAILPRLREIRKELNAIERALGIDAGDLLDSTLKESMPIEIPPEDDTTAEADKPLRSRIIDALARLHALGTDSADRQTVAAIVNVDTKSEAWRVAFDALISEQLIERGGKDCIGLTVKGFEFAEAVEAPTSLAEHHAAAIKLLGPVCGAMISKLLAVHPEAVSRADLATSIGQKSSASSFNTKLGMLRLLDYAIYPEGGYVAASGGLFPAHLEQKAAV